LINFELNKDEKRILAFTYPCLTQALGLMNCSGLASKRAGTSHAGRSRRPMTVLSLTPLFSFLLQNNLCFEFTPANVA